MLVLFRKHRQKQLLTVINVCVLKELEMIFVFLLLYCLCLSSYDLSLSGSGVQSQVFHGILFRSSSLHWMLCSRYERKKKTFFFFLGIILWVPPKAPYPTGSSAPYRMCQVSEKGALFPVNRNWCSSERVCLFKAMLVTLGLCSGRGVLDKCRGTLLEECDWFAGDKQRSDTSEPFAGHNYRDGRFLQ